MLKVGIEFSNSGHEKSSSTEVSDDDHLDFMQGSDKVNMDTKTKVAKQKMKGTLGT